MTATTTTPTSALVPPPALLWDESFRYYRLSQATDDLLDGFRNLYLAFESLLSLIRPRRQSPRRGGGMTFEGEGVWLKEALRAADTIEPLAGHVPVGTASPVDFLHDDLYIAHRNTLFHSKRSASSSAPVPGARTSVEESLRRLVRLYLKLVSAKLGVTFPTSSWNLPALQPYAATLLSGVTVALSDDPSPASSDSPNPAGGALVRLPTSPPVLVGHVQIVRGIASTQLAAIPAIRRFVLLNAAGTVLSSEVFDEGPLLHNGISNLEVHVGLRLDNTREARTRYSR